MQVQEGDGLPELMCIPCVLQVSRAFTFKQQCRRSNQTLRSFNEKITGTDNNNIKVEFKSTETESADVPLNESIIEEQTLINNTEEHQYHSNDDTVTDNDLDSELVLASLPPDIEPDSFEEEIELSSLPSEAEFTEVADEEIQSHLTADVLNSDDEEVDEIVNVNKDKNLQSKFGDYFDEIKLEAHSVPLDESELPDESIEESFGKTDSE